MCTDQVARYLAFTKSTIGS